MSRNTIPREFSNLFLIVAQAKKSSFVVHYLYWISHAKAYKK
jgi:hypothetical protein